MNRRLFFETYSSVVKSGYTIGKFLGLFRAGGLEKLEVECISKLVLWPLCELEQKAVIALLLLSFIDSYHHS